VILLAASVEEELAFWRARDDVITLTMGIGPVEASCALAEMLGRRPFRLVVNAGLGGAFDGAAAIGEGVVVADEAIELNLETGSPLALPAWMKIVDRAASDTALVAALRERGFAALHGITVARVTSTDATARRLANELGAQVESMEGFAALRAAQRAGIPAVELRGISNRCGDRSASQWNFAAGIAGLERIVNAFFDSQL
jgi:futalosine hydrolase